MRIITRIILFIPMLIIHSIWGVWILIRTMYIFMRYGGEIVSYQKDNDAKTVLDTYLKLKDFLDNQTPPPQ